MIGPRFQWPALCAVLVVTISSTGCNLAGILIKSTVDATQEFTEEKGGEFADPETLGPVVAAGTITAEGTMYFVPEYEPLLRSAIWSNIAYGAGWLSAQANDAELAGKYDDVTRLNKRMGILYARALQLTKRMLRLRDDGYDAAMAGGVETFKVWVDDNFYEKEDAKVALLSGLAYFVAMLKSEDGLAASVDRPYAQYLVERSVELDPELQGSTGLATLGTVWCTVPKMVGGDPELGLQLMKRAMAITNRGAHAIMVSTAERCATALQDRKMFHDLLTEVIEARDVPKYRLPNKLARHNAERLLKQIDELFYE